MIQVRGVTQTFSEGSPVLQDVHFQVQRGEFVYVLGGSGAGKSTLLRLMATETVPTNGDVELFGYSIRKLSRDELAQLRRTIGYVPQGSQLIPDLTVYENVELSWRFGPTKNKSADPRLTIREVLERLKLFDKRDTLCSRLSGGEAQRVAIARALVRSPEVIIADEPTGAQDRDMSWDLMQLLLQLNAKGTTIVLATHDRELVRKMRKKCVVLREGALKVEDSLWL